MKLNTLHAAVFAVLSSTVLAAGAADDTFVTKAASGGMAEVNAGQLAQQQGSSDAVKQFGQKMVADHSKANDELKSIASGKNMQLPTTPDAMHQKAMASLQAKSGASFDKAFKTQMVADHKATIALFQREASSGTDADLKGLRPRRCLTCTTT